MAILIFGHTTGEGSSSPWEFGNASYDNKSVNINSQTAFPRSVYFKSDGTKMYVLGLNLSGVSANDGVVQYSLSVAWDVSTATYDSVFFDFNSVDPGVTGMFIKPDGTKLYLTSVNNDQVSPCTMSTPWDLSTATYDGSGGSVSTQGSNPSGVFFKPDGTGLFVTDLLNNEVYAYSLSIAWDVTSIMTHLATEDLSGQDTQLHDVAFKSDGTSMFIVGNQNNNVYRYSLSSAWDITSLSLAETFNVSQDSGPTGVAFNGDGTKMYVAGDATDSVYQYSL